MRDTLSRVQLYWPGIVIGLLVGAYWARVLKLVLKARRETGRSANFLPPEPLGRAIFQRRDGQPVPRVAGPRGDSRRRRGRERPPAGTAHRDPREIPRARAGGSRQGLARAFLNVLQDNNKLLEAQRLFSEVSTSLALGAMNAPVSQSPEYAPIRYAGHESGEFFFLPKGGGSAAGP